MLDLKIDLGQLIQQIFVVQPQLTYLTNLNHLNMEEKNQFLGETENT